MAPRLQPDQAQARRVLGHGPGQDVTALAVDLPHPPHVPVVATRLQQRGERQLVEGRGPATGQELLADHRTDQSRRPQQPAETDPGGQGLAQRTQGQDPVGGESLQGAHGLPVIPELGVVVVLQDDPVDLRRPRDQGLPSLGSHHHPGGALVSRRDDDGLGARVTERVDVQACTVDRHGHRLHPRAPDYLVVLAGPGILEADPLDARAREGAQRQHETLPEAVDDHGVLCLGGAGTHATVVGRHHLPQPQGTRVVLVAHHRGRRRTPGLAQCPQPVPQWRGRQVGHAVLEVDLDPVPPRRGRAARSGGSWPAGRLAHPLGHPRAGAGRPHQVALGDELLVAGDHHAPGDLQLLGEPPRGRQPLARAQPPVAHRRAQLVLELVSEGGSVGPVQGQQQVRPFPRPGDAHPTLHPKWSDVARPKWTFRVGRVRATIDP